MRKKEKRPVLPKRPPLSDEEREIPSGVVGENKVVLSMRPPRFGS